MMKISIRGWKMKKVFPFMFDPLAARLVTVSLSHQLLKSLIHCFVKAYGKGHKRNYKSSLSFEGTLCTALSSSVQ